MMHVDWVVEYTHGQFSLLDAGDVSDCTITDQGIADRATMNDDRTGITIFSPRHGTFALVTIDVVDDRPTMSFDTWDHVVELSLWSLSGGLEISTICGNLVYDPDSGEQIPSELKVEPEIYQLYVLFANLAAMEKRLNDPNETEYGKLFYGERGIPDRDVLTSYENYRIVLWPLKAKVVKRFNNS